MSWSPEELQRAHLAATSANHQDIHQIDIIDNKLCIVIWKGSIELIHEDWVFTYWWYEDDKKEDRTLSYIPTKKDENMWYAWNIEEAPIKAYLMWIRMSTEMDKLLE